VPRHRGLADALPRPDHRERRQVERLQPWRLEAEVRADVRQPEDERAAGEPEALGRWQHRFVGKVDDDVRLDGVERVDKRYPVVVAPSQLFRAADKQRADELVWQRRERITNNRCVMLTVDDRYRSDEARTSSSMRVVYFSYSRVSVENWMIFSCPWYG